jgi:hypothetical protein
LKGIDRAFESYQRSRRGAGKPLKSLAYCTDAVLEAAQESQEAAVGAQPANGSAPAKEAFSREDVRAYLERNISSLKKAAERVADSQAAVAEFLGRVANSLSGAMTLLESPGPVDLEDLKLHASLMSNASEGLMLKIRREVDSQLSAYRRKMKAPQLAVVEKQYLQKRLLDEYRLPRLSLFYFG